MSITTTQLQQQRLATSLQLLAFAEEALRARYLREQPDLTPQEIDQRVGAWLHTRPGAEFGDCSGPIRVRSL